MVPYPIGAPSIEKNSPVFQVKTRESKAENTPVF